MVKYILNGWGWNMPQPSKGTVTFEDLTKEEFEEEIKGAISCIGNPALARVLELPYSPSYINLQPGDVAIVITMRGGKLPHNASEVPENVHLKFTRTEVATV